MHNPAFLTSSHGVRMPRILYGTAWKKERTADLVTQAIRLGFRGIDTAGQPKHYHEPGVGAAVAACLQQGLSREELYLQSKFTSLNGQDPTRIPYDPTAPLGEQVAQSFQSSLANLQTDYLDCLVLHSPMANPALTQEVWQAMEQLFDQGSVKQLGISNCYHPRLLEMLYQSSRIKPAVLQNRFYADTQYDHGLRAFCRQNRIVYQSFWTLTANPRILAHPVLLALAKKYQRTAPQIFFRCLSQMEIVPLTGTTSATHMAEDLAIFEFELHPEECEAINRLLI
ncbi:MAG: aldo/keto reductase [Magnetococcales bacterium]|nr:aldo/keto reductase [Magnetococcales bacterium]